MQDMLAKGKAAKQDEEVKFAAYKQFCEGTSQEKKTNIADAAAEIEDLQARYISCCFDSVAARH